MTFGAMAAWQAWLFVGAAAALAAGLFLVKLKPPRLFVPSLLLWRRVLDEAREMTLWERIRRAVSLALTVLIALALALAAARPGHREVAAAPTSGRLLVVLDSSWSMRARTTSGETRWERGVAEARRLFAAAAGAEIALATTGEGLIEGPTTDTALVESALARLTASGGPAGAWPALADAAAVHFVTDGAAAVPLDRAVIVHSVFEPADNVAITSLDVRPPLSGDHAGEAYLEIANFAAAAQTVRLTLTRGQDQVFDRDLEVAASGALRQVVPIARGGDPALIARVRAEANALTVDDEAVAWVTRARPLPVLVVGDESGWLRDAFARNPDVQPVFVAAAAYRPLDGGRRRDQQPEQVVIFDRTAPATPPGQPALLIAPPQDTPWLSGGTPAALPGLPPARNVERQPRWEAAGHHPVVAGVDPFTLSIDRAQGYSSPTLTPIARSTRGTPLVSVDEAPDRRYVVMGFGPAESNLAAAPGFPVLLGNALEWLARPAGGTVLGPGVATIDASVTSLTGPDGREVPLTRIGDRLVARLREPGLYVADGGGARSRFTVIAGAANVSNLSRTTPIQAGQARPVAAGASSTPWWVYGAVLAFLLALVEWWTWHRRITV